MLLERRAYTFRPDAVDAFWQANLERGITADVRPIMGRAIGYFETISGRDRQIVHLWRYDDYDDWFNRLFFKSDAAGAYYAKVRPLMLAQENRFMVPLPIAELTPLWGNGNDWRTGDAPRADLRVTPGLLLEENSFVLVPGSLDIWLDAAKRLLEPRDTVFAAHVLGGMRTLVGRQHQLQIYRLYPDFETRERHRATLHAEAGWKTFCETIRPLVQEQETLLLRPGPLPGCTPLLRF